MEECRDGILNTVTLEDNKIQTDIAYTRVKGNNPLSSPESSVGTNSKDKCSILGLVKATAKYLYHICVLQ